MCRSAQLAFSSRSASQPLGARASRPHIGNDLPDIRDGWNQLGCSSFAGVSRIVGRDATLLSDLIDDLIAPGHGVILAMGKGGVGKTTVAAAVAVAIAKRGYEVHLSTTDPAAHLVAALGNEPLANLTVRRIDPEVETAKYAAEVLGKAGASLDAQGKALLEEDLRSPCTEEIAVFRAFADAVAAGTNKFVVLDTAPPVIPFVARFSACLPS